MKSSKKKLALFYPWIKSKGGSEKVILEILKSRKYDVDIYTWVYEPEHSFEDFKKFKINVIAPKFLKKLGKSKILRGLFFPASIFSKIPLEKYDSFLIYTAGVGELIVFKNHKRGRTYIYSNTPLRYASKEIVKWNLKNIYKNPFSKIIYLLSVKIYNFFERMAWKKIDRAIFISEVSRKRAIEKNLTGENLSKIVYPPVNFQNQKKGKSERGEYFLYLSRFNAPKRQDLLIKAWEVFSKKYPKENLVLAGHIENKKYFEKIKKLAKRSENVLIKPNLSDKEKQELYTKCKAVIFVPFKEDFGIVPFEALAFGKPVIGVDEGGYVELIRDHPQFFKIKELHSQEKMVEEINRCLENFLKSKSHPQKKIVFNKITSRNFIKELEKILE